MNYLAVYFSLYVLTGIGFILLIVPGLYLTTIFIFADIAVVLENKKYMDAFHRSMDLVKGCFWQVFLFLLSLVSLSLIPFALSQLLRLVSSWPFAGC